MIIDNLFENNKKVAEGEVYDLEKEYGYEKPKSQPRRSAPSDYPYSQQEDDDYFREIFRKNREAAKKAEQEKGVGEARVGNRMSDIEIGSPKIVYYKGKAVGEVGIDHEASPGNGQYYFKHYLSGKDQVGYDTKQEALAELKYMVQQMNEGQQLDELSWKDIQRGAKKIGKGAQKFTKNVADTGAAIGGAAKDVGGAIKQVGQTAVASPVSAAYNATKSGLNKAANVVGNTYNDVKAGAQKVGRATNTVAQDVGDAGTWAGEKIKQAGRGVANVAGGTAGGLGAVAGGATTGLGRAAAHGFNTGVQNVGGDAVERLQTNIMKQIDAKKTEIAGLEKELAKVSTQAPAVANTVTDQGGAINPDTGMAYTPAEVADWEEANRVRGELLPKIKADLAAQGGGYNLAPAANKMLTKPSSTATIPAATPAPGAPSKVTYGKGFNAPAPQKSAVPNYGQKTPGYNYTTSVTPTATPSTPRVTAGGPTPAERKALDQRIAAAAQAQPVAETVKQVKRMMETVSSKADVQRIKDYIDYHMGANLNESTRLKRNRLISEVTQLAATRRREAARRLAQ